MQENKKNGVTNGLAAFSLFLMFLYLYSTSLTSFVYSSHGIAHATIGVAVGCAAICYFIKSGYSQGVGAEYCWVVIAAMAMFRNGDFAHSNYTPIMLYISCITVMIAFSYFSGWQKYVIGIMCIFTAFHMITGVYFLINKSVLVRSIVPQFGLDIYNTARLKTMIYRDYMTGLTSHYSTMGMYMAFGLIVVFFWAFKRNKYKFGVVMSIPVIAAFVCLFLTGKRAHLIFAAVSLLVVYLGFLGKNSGSAKLKRIMGLILVAAVSLVIMSSLPQFSAIMARFKIGEDSSLGEISNGRLDLLWIPAFKLFSKNKLFGIGWRNFKYDFKQYSSMRVNNDAHNIYLQLLCETGIVGFVIIMSILLFTFYITYKTLKEERARFEETGEVSDRMYYLAFSFTVQLFFFMYGMTGNPLYQFECYLPYMLACAMTYRARREIKDEAAQTVKKKSFGKQSA